MNDSADKPVFVLAYNEVAEANIEEGYQWILQLPYGGFDSAERWLTGINAFILAEVALLNAVEFRRAPSPESLPGRNRYAIIYRTGNRSKGSPWRIVYELRDEDDDGKLDTFQVIGIHHAAGER